MPTLGPQIVSESYGNLLKFLPVGEAGVTTSQVQITDGKGKVTPLQLATGSVLVDNEFTASAEVVFSGLTSTSTLGQYVSFDTSDGRLYYSNTSSIVPTNAISASWAPDDGDWTIGSTYMTASGQDNVFIPGKLENGRGNFAQGNDSHAEGSHSLSSGQFSHAEGRATSASGYGSHAEGVETNSPGAAAHAEGKGTIAGVGLGDGDLAHAEGHYTKALSFASHAEGNNTYASASYAHAEGNATSASGEGSHAEGLRTLASSPYSHAEGTGSIASHDYSHAEGLRTVASGLASHAEGKGTIASDTVAHAEGHVTVASGFMSHAEGDKTLASGKGAHSEGQYTTASGDYSHAEGDNTWARGKYSHAGGANTNADLPGQTVVGQYNKENYPDGNDTFVVGVGGNNNHLADGLKVRQTFYSGLVYALSEGAVIARPTLVPQAPGASGFYLGEPEEANTIRFVNHLVNQQLLIQRFDGNSYTNLITVTANAFQTF